MTLSLHADPQLNSPLLKGRTLTYKKVQIHLQYTIFFLSVESLFTTIHPMNLFMCLLKNTCSHKINEFLVTVPSTLSSFGLIKEWLFTIIVTVQITLCVISYQPLHYLEKTSISCSSQMSIVSQDSSFLFPFSLSVE